MHAATEGASGMQTVPKNPIAMSDTCVVGQGVEPCQERMVPVLWMMSGCEVCSMRVTHGTRAIDVKQHIYANANVPIAEQHLFVDGCELATPCTALDGLALTLLTLLRVPLDPRNTNLAHFHNFVDLQPLLGTFRKVRRLASAIHGSVELCSWCRPGAKDKDMHVVVKKMSGTAVDKSRGKETNEWTAHVRPNFRSAPCAEDALAELGVFSFLGQHDNLSPHILRPLGTFSTCGSTWLVTEFADGGDLLEVCATQALLPEEKIKTYMWQILSAVLHLDQHGIGHRDISLENLLFKDGIVKLMDFGMAVQSTSSSGHEPRCSNDAQRSR
eukprot:NODE_10734_length_1332_cov_22.567635.p1 GENE.NODE_10734_length_1332_cov_22.567635~~NODE_10734_length_1332_cov_22.567635.p1  ORF type:complete len:328 (-),score=71.30 NODE_10734_length_1332_cov_22.567635:238-1221(-)